MWDLERGVWLVCEELLGHFCLPRRSGIGDRVGWLVSSSFSKDSGSQKVGKSKSREHREEPVWAKWAGRASRRGCKRGERERRKCSFPNRTRCGRSRKVRERLCVGTREGGFGQVHCPSWLAQALSLPKAFQVLPRTALLILSLPRDILQALTQSLGPCSRQEGGWERPRRPRRAPCPLLLPYP